MKWNHITVRCKRFFPPSIKSFCLRLDSHFPLFIPPTPACLLSAVLFVCEMGLCTNLSSAVECFWLPSHSCCTTHRRASLHHTLRHPPSTSHIPTYLMYIYSLYMHTYSDVTAQSIAYLKGTLTHKCAMYTPLPLCLHCKQWAHLSKCAMSMSSLQTILHVHTLHSKALKQTHLSVHCTQWKHCKRVPLLQSV